MWKTILEILNLQCDKECPQFSTNSFVKFSAEISSKRFYVIDGGSAVILDGGGWLLSKIKIGEVCYESGKKTLEKVNSFFFGASKQDGSFKMTLKPDAELKQPGNTKIEDVPNFIRSLLEWKTALEVANKLERGDFLVMDSSLIVQNQHQNEAIKKVIAVCEKNGINLIGVSKSSRKCFANGRSVLGFLNSFGKKNLAKERWYVSFENDYYARLHPLSKFCYKIHFKGDEKKIFSALAYYANDAEIPGYPYPLIRADQIARVSEDEKKLENINIKNLARNLKYDFVELDEYSTIMHDFLDERNYR